MERYFVVEKGGQCVEIYCEKGSLVFDKTGKEIIRHNTAKLWSLCHINGGFTSVYSDYEYRFFVSVIADEKIKSEKFIFRNKDIKNCFAVPVSYGIKIYSSEKIAAGFRISEKTVSVQNAVNKVLCHNSKNGNMKLFSSAECTYIAYETEKGISVTNCETGETVELDGKIADFSFGAAGGKIYCLCMSDKGVKLYAADKNGIEKADVFKGGCKECALAFWSNRIYAAANDANKICIRRCNGAELKFLPMIQIPFSAEMMKVVFVGDVVRGEVFCTEDVLKFIKSMCKAEKKEVKEPENESVKNMLTANVKELTSQNNMLNMKINSMRENHRLQINQMEKEVLHLKKENELCKKAQKILENEIYRLNNAKEEEQVCKIIDNDEKNC